MPGDTALSSDGFRRLVWLMAITAGVVVANNYYNQPLLAEMADDFGRSERSVALIATLTQVGYALGLFFLLPLGDMVERRWIISLLLVASSVALLTFAFAPSFPALVFIGFFVGFSSVVPQFLPPIASRLAPRGQSGQAVGFVMGGLLLGIILSRFAGGLLGGVFGWRTVYLVAALLMIILLILLRRSIPVMQPTFEGSYYSLISSLAGLFLRHRRLRHLAFVAAVQFGAFSMFWTTIVFHVEQSMGGEASLIVGLLALIGAIGVLAAPMAGRLADRMSAGTIISASGALMATSFVIMGLSGGTLLWLIPAIVLLDLGMQVGHVTSMSEALQLDPEAGNRVNTIYMVTRFGGAALGTFGGSQAWHYYGWTGVTAVGAVVTVLAFAATVAPQLVPATAADHD